MEQLDYNLLFRWFVGPSADVTIRDVTVFTKNRGRLLEGEMAAKVLSAAADQARSRDLLARTGGG